jgi:hypothetical protein
MDVPCGDECGEEVDAQLSIVLKVYVYILGKMKSILIW